MADRSQFLSGPQFQKWLAQQGRKSTLCWAPATNLNFAANGAATVCCQSTHIVLGRYPENSVQDIWNSELAKDFRERMAQNQVAEDCRLCVENIQAGHFELMLAKGFEANVPQASMAKPRLTSIDFALSNICNFECLMCNGEQSSLIRKNREKRTPLKNPYDENFVRQLRPLWPQIRAAGFVGGEPFLNSLYFQMWDDVSSINPDIKVNITTNGSVLNEKVLRILQDLKPKLSISVDGWSKETYEKIRLHGRFDVMRKNLDSFLAYAKVFGKYISMQVCPLTLNWHEIHELVAWTTEHQVVIYFNTVVEPQELSLRSCSSELRLKILRSWRNEYEKLKPRVRGDEARAVADQNKANWLGLIKQVEYWEKAFGNKAT